MTMKLREMEVLHAVVKTGTMSAAARQLSTSQPAVSQVVRHVEKRLGVALFEREGNRIHPTPELLELAKELDLIFNTVESARRLAAVLDLGAGRILRVGAIPSLAGAFLPEAIASLRARYPAVQFITRFQDPAPIKDAIIRRDFDLGLMYAEAQREGLEIIPLCDAPVVCIVRRDDVLADKPVLTPDILGDRPLISFAKNSPIGESLDAIFASAGSVRDVIIQTQHSHAAPDYVRRGLGVALTDPFFAGTTDLDGLVVKPFQPTRVLTPKLVYVEGRRLSELEAIFVDDLKIAARGWLQRTQ